TSEFVTRVYFEGVDSSEFSVWRNQINAIPLQEFEMSPGDSIWVDIIFKADIKMPDQYRDRHADLVVLGQHSTDTIHFTGSIIHAELAVYPPSLDFGLSRMDNQVSRTLTISNPGTAPLVISLAQFGLSGDGDSTFSMGSSSLNVGDTILPGHDTVITINGFLQRLGDANSILKLAGLTSCVDTATIPLTMQTTLL